MTAIQRIVITGGLGFIGSHTAITLSEHGFTVYVIDNLSRPMVPSHPKYHKEPYTPEYLHEHYPKIRHVIGDIRDFAWVCEQFDRIQPHVIIHAAGQTSAVDSLAHPAYDFTNNCVGSFYVLEAARLQSQLQLFLYISTNKVYGTLDHLPAPKEKKQRYVLPDQLEGGIDESQPLSAVTHTPYGVSKLCGDLYTQEYGSLFPFHAAVFRLSCVYGPRQFGFVEQGWVSHLLIQAMLGKPITIFGNGKQVRDLLYIDDLTRLFLQYIHLVQDGSLEKDTQEMAVYNVGGGPQFSVSLREFLTFLQEDFDYDLKIAYQDWRPADQKIYISNIKKISTTTGWQPQISPTQGIRQTLNWIQQHKELFMK